MTKRINNIPKYGRIPSVALNTRNELDSIRAVIRLEISVSKYTWDQIFQCFYIVYLTDTNLFVEELANIGNEINDKEGRIPQIYKKTFRKIDKIRADLALLYIDLTWDSALRCLIRVYDKHKELFINTEYISRFLPHLWALIQFLYIRK